MFTLQQDVRPQIVLEQALRVGLREVFGGGGGVFLRSQSLGAKGDSFQTGLKKFISSLFNLSLISAKKVFLREKSKSQSELLRNDNENGKNAHLN